MKKNTNNNIIETIIVKFELENFPIIKLTAIS